MDNGKLTDIIKSFYNNKTELEHVEFKENYHGHDELAKNISAISNVLVRRDLARGYIIYGVSDSCKLVGTNFNYGSEKAKGAPLEIWLNNSLSPAPNVTFQKLTIESTQIVVAIINRPSSLVKYNKEAFIRIGSSTTELRQNTEIQRELEQKCSSMTFENVISMSDLSLEDIGAMLELEKFKKNREKVSPVTVDQLTQTLINGGIITNNNDSTYNITNLGALLLAKNLDDFNSLKFFAPRIIEFSSIDSLQIKNDEILSKGYGVSFEELYNDVLKRMTSEQVIEGALRKETNNVPTLALRELLANMLIHQDFMISDVRPTVSIYNDRIEILNSGKPLIQKEDFIQSPSIRRNKEFAEQMRLLGICEEVGSGWKKVVLEIDRGQYPIPKIEISEKYTKVTLYYKLHVKVQTKADRLNTIYYHVWHRYLVGDYATNSSIREKFNIDEKNSAMATRLLKEAEAEKLIKVFDNNSGRKYRQYVPYETESNA
jgi:predicted HTH transcriptional regulator